MDKRKINRRFLLFYMRVFDADARQQIGNLVDITLRGMMVVSEHPLARGGVRRRAGAHRGGQAEAFSGLRPPLRHADRRGEEHGARARHHAADGGGPWG